MNTWKTDCRRGCRWLARHRALRALSYFERSLLNAPVSRATVRRSELARAFYLLSVALRRAGMHNRAVGSLVESARLNKRGPASRKLPRITNEYGMARQAVPEADDRHAFYGVQLARYIRSKRSHRLGTRAEIDMIAELIDDYWEYLRTSGLLEGKTSRQKLQLFRDTMIVFPFLSVPRSLKTEDLAVDFGRGCKVGPEDRCVCGSGLAYKMCHGRTPGSDEVLLGKF